jgi:hypothetical protein
VKVRPVAAEVLTKERRELSFMGGGVLVLVTMRNVNTLDRNAGGKSNIF